MPTIRAPPGKCTDGTVPGGGKWLQIFGIAPRATMNADGFGTMETKDDLFLCLGLSKVATRPFLMSNEAKEDTPQDDRCGAIATAKVTQDDFWVEYSAETTTMRGRIFIKHKEPGTFREIRDDESMSAKRVHKKENRSTDLEQLLEEAIYEQMNVVEACVDLVQEVDSLKITMDDKEKENEKIIAELTKKEADLIKENASLKTKLTKIKILEHKLLRLQKKITKKGKITKKENDSILLQIDHYQKTLEAPTVDGTRTFKCASSLRTCEIMDIDLSSLTTSLLAVTHGDPCNDEVV
jgi:hypothetical protein